VNDITVVLTVYRRPEYLGKQVQALLAQSIKPKEIWVLVHEHESNKDYSFKFPGVTSVIKSSRNFKYHGRFALGLLAQTQYVALFDDDTIPGEDWFKNCLDHAVSPEGEMRVLGGVGLRLWANSYNPHDRYGWPSANEELTQVDLVGHAWFFDKNLLKLFWLNVPSLENCEDLQLSVNAQLYSGGKVKTYVPPHPASNPKLWSSLKAKELGEDGKASSAGPNAGLFFAQRDACIQLALKNGWKRVNEEAIDSLRNPA
jgi:hypothetical protein